MAYPSDPQAWRFYFSRHNHQDAIDFYNVCLEQDLASGNFKDDYLASITATPSHIIVRCEIDAFTFGDCDNNEESEIWYSKCDFVETHECTRINNPNKD